MSETRLHYTVYFSTRGQAAAWAAEAEACADQPLDEQTTVLRALLGLDEDDAAHFEFSSAAELAAEVAVTGSWKLQPALGWPPGLVARGASLFSCEWSNGDKLEGLWFNGPKAVTRKQFEAAVRKLDPLEGVHQLLQKERYGELLDLVHHHGLDPNTVLYFRPLIVHLLTPQAGKSGGVLPTDTVIALLKAGARPEPLALVTRMPSYTLPVFPLQCAARAFDIPLMQALLDAGVDVNAVDDQGETALHHLAEGSKYLRKPVARAVGAAQWLLDAGAHVNALASNGASPCGQSMHRAVRDLLVAHGAEVAWPDYARAGDASAQQRNAISYFDHPRLDALLAEAPPDDACRLELLVRAVGEGNHHALYRLWRRGDHALMCLGEDHQRALLAERITEQEDMNLAMLDDLAQRSLTEPFPPRDAAWLNAANLCLRHFVYEVNQQPDEMVQRLLAMGLSAEPPPEDQHSPLSSAIQAKATGKVALLLEYGADPNRPTYQDGNALHCALEAKATDCIALLLQAGADRNRCDRQGRTPLQLAVVKRNKTAQKLLSA